MRALWYLTVLLVSFGYTSSAKVHYNKFRLPVIDSTWALKPVEYEQYRNRIADFNKNSPYEIVVIFVKRGYGRDTWELAKEMAISGRYSRKSPDNLLFILVAMKDRDIGFFRGADVAKRLEYPVLDSVLRDRILPLFAKQKFNEGINLGTSDFIRVLEPGYLKNEITYTKITILSLAGLTIVTLLVVLIKRKAAR